MEPDILESAFEPFFTSNLDGEHQQALTAAGR
jgi:hypothetical protein